MKRGRKWNYGDFLVIMEKYYIFFPLYHNKVVFLLLANTLKND